MTSGEDHSNRTRWLIGTAIALIGGIVIPLYLAFHNVKNDPQQLTLGLPSPTSAAPSEPSTPPATKPATGPQPATTAPRSRGILIHSGVLYSKCVTAAGTRLADGTAVVIEDCDASSTAQDWFVNTNRTITLGAKPSMCLDVAGGGLSQGALMVLNRCVNPAASSGTQRWSFQPGGAIRSAEGNWCLDDPFGDVSNGIHLEIVGCDSSGKPWPPQQWFPG
jgi:Ricin-type beta-trefoil lectin domain